MCAFTLDATIGRRHSILKSEVKEEAQLLLGWPTHSAKLIYLEVKVIEIRCPKCPMASMISILRHETPHAIFSYVILIYITS